MRIEVVIENWEQACCGQPIRVGERMTRKVLAENPTTTPAGAPPLFRAEQHDQTPDEVPHWDVTGTVVSIMQVRYPQVPMPGAARVFTADLSKPTFHPTEQVWSHDDSDIDDSSDAVEDEDDDDLSSEYRVTVDVPDETPLPSYVRSARQAAHEAALAQAAARDLAWMVDEIGVLLEELADDAQRRYGHVATFTRMTDRSALTVEPHNARAAAIRWARVGDNGAGFISVSVGDGEWSFRASTAHANRVHDFLAAAAAGQVYEHVGRKTGRRQRLETEVVTSNGRRWIDTSSFESMRGEGFQWVAGRQWVRLQRGEMQYLPWSENDTE